MKLFRLRSNPKTIVRKVQKDMYKVVSTETMRKCNYGKGCSICDATWMLSFQRAENLIPI
jgi:hypothetical protein